MAKALVRGKASQKGLAQAVRKGIRQLTANKVSVTTKVKPKARWSQSGGWVLDISDPWSQKGGWYLDIDGKGSRVRPSDVKGRKGAKKKVSVRAALAKARG